MPVYPYECVVVVDPTKAEQDIKAQLTRFEETIAQYGGRVTSRDDWGRRRLAYEINRRREGFYSVIYFEGDSAGQMLPELKRVLRIDEAVMRFLVVRSEAAKSKGDPALADRLQAQLSAPRYPRRPPMGGAPRGAEEPVAAAAEAAPPAAE